jgi:hypothetical protein
MNIDVGIIGGLSGVLLLLPPHMLFVIQKRHVEIKRLVSLRESQTHERVLSTPILDPQHEVPR